MFPFTKSIQQVAALPFAPREGGIDVLLVTARSDGRWLFPKGGPEGARPFAEEAAREAREEAGVTGAVHPEALGHYTYRKRMSGGYAVRARVLVYPLVVRDVQDDWPERGQRERRWVALDAAAALVGDTSLSRLIARLARQGGAPLRAAADALAAATDTDNPQPTAC